MKDTKLEGGWGFFEFDGKGPAQMVKRPATCYQCHESHAAVDTTFVQFYPTLLEPAKTKGTLSASYLKEAATESKKLRRSCPHRANSYASRDRINNASSSYQLQRERF